MHPKSLFSRRSFAPEKVQCHLMWVKYAIKFRFEVSPLMGSLGRLGGTSLGTAFFL
jgi:hypothetical protein